MKRNFVVVYLIVFVSVVIILSTSFTRLKAYSETDSNSLLTPEIPFPEDYEHWVMLDSVPQVPFPEGYRSWTHVKSAVALPSGYHHIYANELAMEGYRTGKFPHGSVLVADFLEMIDNKTGIAEGKRRYVDVMVRDTLHYRFTGGWGFEEFDGNSKSIRKITQANAHTACYTCHTKRTANDFVFSEYRE